MDIKFVESDTLKEKPTGALGFGKIYTDYMFVADYDADQGDGTTFGSSRSDRSLFLRPAWCFTMPRKRLKD